MDGWIYTYCRGRLPYQEKRAAFDEHVEGKMETETKVYVDDKYSGFIFENMYTYAWNSECLAPWKTYV